MIRKYDTTFIIDGNLPDAERQALIERFAGILRRLGGDIDQIIRWGQRTLAYQINKRTHGYYVIFYYFSEPSVIAQFERELRLNEYILRYMTLVFEGKHPEYIRDESAPETASVSSGAVEEIKEETEEEVETIEEESEEFEEESSLEEETEEEENTEEKEND